MLKQSKRLSSKIVNISMLLFMLWLLLPTVQTTTRAVTGAATIAIFGIGVLLDGSTIRNQWFDFLPRVLAAVFLPFLLLFFLDRGGNHQAGFYVQQGMFWFPLLWCAYVRGQNNPALYRWVFRAFLILVLITALTTTFWLLENILRENPQYSYARELIHGFEDRADLRKLIMRRNIGGYGFIYLSVLLLPVAAYGIIHSRRWKRLGLIALYAVLLAMITMSEYTYPLIFASMITAIELLSGLFRKLFRKLSVLYSFLLTLPVFLLLFVFREPIVTWLAQIAAAIDARSTARSLNSLLTAMSGGALEFDSRLGHYLIAVDGFTASPMIGSILGGNKLLSQHSDLLDLLSGLGILGTAVFFGGVWIIGRGSAKGIAQVKQSFIPHLWLQWLVFILVFSLNTVFYSCEISLVMCLSIAFALQYANEPKDRLQAVCV